jgi:LacI family transcriptional regulator
MTKKISIKKLADELKLAPSTVHRALSGHPSVGLDTRRKVLRAAQKKGYLLPIHETGNIAIIISDYSFKGYLSSFLPCLNAEFHRRGFRVLIVSQADIALLGDRMFDGIISLVWSKGFEKMLPQRFSIPTIILNGPANPMENIPNIRSDNSEGIRRALEYLQNHGCRRIFYIGAPYINNVPDAAERLAAFRNFCLKTGQDYDALHLEVRTHEIETKIPLILKAKPDACFCSGETFAVKVGQLIKAAGKRIPEDISLMGLEDDYANAVFTPSVTSIRQNFEKIAEMAADQIAAACRNKIPPRGGLVPFTLIERESVRKPGRKSSRSGK